MRVYVLAVHYHYSDGDTVSVHATEDGAIEAGHAMAKPKRAWSFRKEPTPYWHGPGETLCVKVHEVEP